MSTKHISTFSALGYVQASKTQRKLTVSSPDLSYAAICEINRRIYIYRQPSAINSDLRNRKSGQKISQVAKQQVVTLESAADFHGIVATNSKLIVLTCDTIYVVKVWGLCSKHSAKINKTIFSSIFYLFFLQII